MYKYKREHPTSVSDRLSYIADCGASSGLDIVTLRRYTNQGDVESIMRVLPALSARITSTKKDDLFEHYFQTVILWGGFGIKAYLHCNAALCLLSDCSIKRTDCQYKSFI